MIFAEKKYLKKNGITLDCSEWDGWDYTAGVPTRTERNYRVRICDECKDNIIKYCKRNAKHNLYFSNWG